MRSGLKLHEAQVKWAYDQRGRLTAAQVACTLQCSAATIYAIWQGRSYRQITQHDPRNRLNASEQSHLHSLVAQGIIGHLESLPISREAKEMFDPQSEEMKELFRVQEEREKREREDGEDEGVKER